MQATIEKAVASIRIIQIDGKQMTLSVFKQLPAAKANPRTPFTEESKSNYWGVVRVYYRGVDIWTIGVDKNGNLCKSPLRNSDGSICFDYKHHPDRDDILRYFDTLPQLYIAV